MVNIIDKSILFLIILGIGVLSGLFSLSVIPLLVIISYLCLFTFFEKTSIQIILLVSYLILCLVFQNFTLLIPVICYEFLLTKHQSICLLAILPICFTAQNTGISIIGFTFLFFTLEILLKYRSQKLQKQKKDYILLRDQSKELSLNLENKNKELLEKQDYEINIATLKERNRISMEIHDNVGHLLSSSILQIGAILTMNHDPNLKNHLETLHHTLSTAMDSIRISVHHIHNESLRLEPQVKNLVSQFTFCPVKLDFILNNNPPPKIAYCIITTIKEALSNIIKHSNANFVSITIREHPALYQLRISDNGTNSNVTYSNGIGLKNMENRIYELQGNLNITVKDGFHIFLSIPKNEEKGEN